MTLPELVLYNIKDMNAIIYPPIRQPDIKILFFLSNKKKKKCCFDKVTAIYDYFAAILNRPTEINTDHLGVFRQPENFEVLKKNQA